MSGPTPAELRGLLDIALQAAKVAEEVIMPLYREGTAVELKADSTPVTAADRGAEEAIREFLLRECPGHGVLGEEFGETTGNGDFRWLLDPIDGTKSFIHHVPLFGSLISLEYQGEPVASVIACHAAGETAAAAKGLGATLNGNPIHASSTSELAEATLLATSPQSMHRYQNRAWQALLDSAKLVRTWGDCYGYLMVASGRADIMLDPVMNRWDVSALYPVITEAGGSITTWSGEPGPGDSAIATNGLLHPVVLRVLES